MPKTTIKINYAAIGAMLKSDEAGRICRQAAEERAARAPHSRVDYSVLNTRARAGIVQEMTRVDMDNETLRRAMG